MTKTAILLATYNSEKYIIPLLDSIQNQTYTDWSLTIHDDGSSDRTLDIIEEYMSKDGRISIALEGMKLGAAKSFMELLKITNADYYLFCDHDDVWLPNKVEKTVELLDKISTSNPQLPVIVHSDLYVVNENLQIINNSFWKSSRIDPKVLKFVNISQVFNSVTGCAMAFNNNAKTVSFPYADNLPMHDWWINLCVLKNKGIVEEIAEPLIYYRQHGNNEVGARQVDNSYFYQKLLNIKKTIGDQLTHIKFLRSIGGINFFQYYYYKLYYTIIRNL